MLPLVWLPCPAIQKQGLTLQQRAPFSCFWGHNACKVCCWGSPMARQVLCKSSTLVLCPSFLVHWIVAPSSKPVALHLCWHQCSLQSFRSHFVVFRLSIFGLLLQPSMFCRLPFCLELSGLCALCAVSSGGVFAMQEMSSEKANMTLFKSKCTDTNGNANSVQ